MLLPMQSSFDFRMRHICVFLIALSCSPFYAYAQHDIELHFVPTLKGVVINEQPFCSSSSDSAEICLHVFRFYIHDVQFNSKGRCVTVNPSGHFLIDVKHAASTHLHFTLTDSVSVDELKFTIGVDSVLQQNGAHSGVLDPIEGMYWTWQSGYINWKLEAEMRVVEQKDTITWHIGGYRNPFNTLQKISLPVEVNSLGEVRIALELSHLLHTENTKNNRTIMSPSGQALELSREFTSCFQWLSR
jgi:hypothetical protein